MGKTFKPLAVKLVVGLISNDTLLFEKAGKILSRRFGKIDYISPVFEFNQTDYYEQEMGRGLKRLFLSFQGLIPAERLTKIKIYTNTLETKFSKSSRVRTINIDPGYISLSKLVLATTKSFVHRIYTGHGIFEEITLYFKGRSFQPGAWTYPDYRSENHIHLFNAIREKYRHQIEKKYGLTQLYRCV